MNALTIIPPRPIEGEIVEGGLFLEANPFAMGSFKWVAVAAGATLAEHFEAAAAELPPAYHLHVELWIDEQRIERAYWHSVRPKPGHTVYARVRPHNGKTGKNILRAFLMIAVIIAASYFLGPAAFEAGGWLGLSLGTFTATVVSAIAVTVVTTLAMLAINALIPAPGLTDASGKPKPLLTGSSNQFAPYSPIPRLFGKLRVFPLLAGYPYTEVVGNKQYLRMLLLVGWGPLRISDLRLGETPISLYKNVEVEITEGGPAGWAGNVPITLYNRTVHEVSLSIALTNAGGASTAQTTTTNTIEIGLDITFPFGLVDIDKDGNRNSRSVSFSVQFGVHGSGVWGSPTLETHYDDANMSVSGGHITATAASQDATRITARFKVPAGQYDVRITRLTADSGTPGGSTQHLDGSYWTTLRSFTADNPVLQDQVCLIALRMQATDQLNGTPQQINCIAESYLPVYGIGGELIAGGDGSTTAGWTPTAGAVLSVGSGRLRVSCAGFSNGLAYQSVSAVVGHRYLVQYDKYQGTAADARVTVATGGTTYIDDTDPGDVPNNSTIITAVGTTVTISLEAQGGSTTSYSEFTNISIKDLDANTTWSYQITRSPAWAYADILRRRAGQTFIADSRINIAAISAWNVDCSLIAPNAKEPRWTYDAVIDGGTVFDALREVAACGRAGYAMQDGKYGVVQDKAQATPVQIITPKNSWGYSGTRTYLQQPHAYRVQFSNADLEYQQDELIVYADGYTSANASIFEVLSLKGCVSKTLAFREARYHMAVANLRPEEHTVSMDIEGLRCTRGDRVQLSYDVMVVGKTWGRITGITTSSSNTTAFLVDEDCVFEDGVSYQLRTRTSAGVITVRAVTMTGGPGTTRTLTLSTPEPTATAPGVGDLYVFGETGIETAPMIVKKVQPGDDLTVQITMANYDENIYTADNGTIPPFNSYIGTDPKRTPPTNPQVALRCDHTARVLTSTHGSVNRIAVDIFSPSSRIAISGNEVQFRETGATMWQQDTNTLHPVSETTVYINDDIGGVVLGHTYQVRVRAKGQNGLYSDWVQPADITVTSGLLWPNAPTLATAVGLYHSILLTWTNPTDLDFATVEVRAATSNSFGAATLIGSSKNGAYLHSGLTGVSTWYYWIRAIDTLGNVSADVAVDPGGMQAEEAIGLSPIVAAGTRYFYDHSPTYTATSTSATITLPAGSLTVGSKTVAYNCSPATVSGSASTTVTFNLYVDDPTFSGGALALVATASNTAPYQGDGRIFMGQIVVTFPASGTGSGSGDAGGGGGFTCVASGSWVETLNRGWVLASKVRIGDALRCLTADGKGTEWAPVTGNVVAEPQPVFKITSASGVTLHVSYSTPLTLRDGSVLPVSELDGHELPIFIDELQWEPCTLASAGYLSVCLINLGGRVYAAGDEKGRSILTHNPLSQKP